MRLCSVALESIIFGPKNSVNDTTPHREEENIEKECDGTKDAPSQYVSTDSKQQGRKICQK